MTDPIKPNSESAARGDACVRSEREDATMAGSRPPLSGAPTPIRLRLSRAKGFDLQLLSRSINGLPVMNVARPGKWGNPFNFTKPDWCWVALSYGCRGDALGRRMASVIAFREWISPPDGRRTVSMERGLVAEHGDKRVEIGPRAKAGPAPSLAEVRAALRGHNLACWCPLPEPGQPDHCHAAVLLEVANG